MRVLVAIISGIILKFWGIVILISGFINWLMEIFSAKRNKRLAEFCEPWNTEMYKYIRYLTAVSNKRPFPFSEIERISKFEK